MAQYCTHPVEREGDPAADAALSEADTCDHGECAIGETVELDIHRWRPIADVVADMERTARCLPSER